MALKCQTHKQTLIIQIHIGFAPNQIATRFQKLFRKIVNKNFKMRQMNFIAFDTDPIQIGFWWLLFCLCTKLQHIACVKGINLMCFLSATAFFCSYGLYFTNVFDQKKMLHNQTILMWMGVK